ncbi:MAG: hypothetical protein FJ302_09980 [Planctomycetes bacterium]|nr:hypothetical protein [Planctomycetota bacterium]
MHDRYAEQLGRNGQALAEGNSTELVRAGLLPDGLQYDSSTQITSAAASNGLLIAGFNGSLSAPSVFGGTLDGEDVAFTFSDVSVTPLINKLTHENGFNLRRYFHPAIHAGLVMTEPLSVASVFRNRADNVVAAQHLAHTHLGQIILGISSRGSLQ